MKTLVILISASLFAAAFALGSLEVIASVFCAAGILAITISDYSQTPRVMLTEPAVAAATAERTERLGLAA